MKEQQLQRVAYFAGLLWCVLVARCTAQDGYDGSRCLNQCNANNKIPQGYCSGGIVPLCECIDQFSGQAWDCSERKCPVGTSWFDMPTAEGKAHTTRTECSNKGQCEYHTGKCLCEPDFEGAACNRMRCPGMLGGVPCSGHGRCLTLRELALEMEQLEGKPAVAYNSWDADMIQGCVCDEGWTGHDCSERACPMGNDPLYVGTPEVHYVYTDQTDAKWEVQQIDFTAADINSGDGDVDEVQQLNVTGVNGLLPAGPLRLTFNSTVTSNTTCALCQVHGVYTTSAISLTADANANAAAVQQALNALANLASNSVTVTASIVDASHLFDITFSGNGVGGDVPLLTAACGSTALTLCSITETTQGSYVDGAIVVTYDDSLGYPTLADLHNGGDVEDDSLLISLGPRSATLRPYMQADEIAVSIAQIALNSSAGALQSVVVQRIYNGGPGISWQITFRETARLRGNLPELQLTSYLVLQHPVLAGTAQATVSTTQDGTFISGSFSMNLKYAGALGEEFLTDDTAQFSWNVQAETVEQALNALDKGEGLGTVAVSRVRYPVGIASSIWRGGYMWAITYLSRSETVPLLPQPSDDGLLGGAVIIRTYKQNYEDAPINPTVLLDCRCADCSNTSQHSFRLAVHDELTPPIPYNASAADIHNALRTLTSLGEVTVRLYDTRGSTAAGICDSDGTTAAITMTQFISAAKTPVLQVPAAHIRLPSTAQLFLTFEGRGKYGGWAQRNTRRGIECSGRGICDRSAGTCACFADSEGTALFGPSDNKGGLGAEAQAAQYPFLHDNCGYPLQAVTECPSTDGRQCSAHGTCSGSPEYRCLCDSGFAGPACELPACQSGTSWFDAPLDEDHAHTSTAVCGNKGRCDAGSCVCDGLLRGGSCNVMGCPGSPKLARLPADDTCIRGNPCVTLAALSGSHRYNEEALRMSNGIPYTDWDAEMIRGCACNRTRVYAGANAYALVTPTGYACTQYSCPKGPDPQNTTSLQEMQYEVQSVTCYATAGRLAFRFRNSTSGYALWNTTILERDLYIPDLVKWRKPLEHKLFRLNVTGGFVIDAARGATFCSANGSAFNITFLSLESPLPLLEIVPDSEAAASTNGTLGEVVRLRAGNIGPYECSRRGVCSRTDGRCDCSKQFGNSDGQGGVGDLGDCGNKDVLFKIQRDLATRPIT